MTEIKTSCPKCGGHIAFPPEIAGQKTSCPHCNETIVLGKQRNITVWILTAVALIGTICVGTVFVLKRPSKPVEQIKNHAAESHLTIVEILETKAAKGDAEAMVQLGLLYTTGNGVPTNTTEGESWFMKAAELGNNRAMTALGDAFLQKYFGEQATTIDSATGLPIATTNDVIDPASGLPVSSTNTIIDPATGLPLAPTETPNQKLYSSQAASWYRKAAELGDTNAMRKIVGVIDPSTGLPKGLQNVVLVEESERTRWNRKLAETGDVEVMVELGLSYIHGNGIETNVDEGLKWLQKAADLTNAVAWTTLAQIYETGDGVRRDIREAVRWLAKAAESGDEDAQFRLAKRYDNGTGILKNEATAVKWYTAAAQQGNAHAQFSLGVKCDRGEGVPMDKQKAFEWFLKAADRKFKTYDFGVPEAQFNVGVMYRDGEGVAKDKEESLKWFLRAAKNGDEAAQYRSGADI